MKGNCNIYTLGFYHDITGADKEFAQQFMKDLASSPSNYYHVEDAGDLEFVFGDVVGDITSGSYPIIIVPGIMGSRLFSSSTQFDVDTKVWNPEVTRQGILWIGPKMMGTLYTRPVEEQHSPVGGREYGSLETYRDIVDGLCTAFSEEGGDYRDVYFFSYDWRKK